MPRIIFYPYLNSTLSLPLTLQPLPPLVRYLIFRLVDRGHDAPSNGYWVYRAARQNIQRIQERIQEQAQGPLIATPEV
jgi:hypothetical protein